MNGIVGSKSFQRLNPHLFNPPGPMRASAAVEEESDLHNQILDYCRNKGWLAFHGSMAHRTHRTEGEPDFIILCDGGKTLLVECKDRTGKVSPKQACVIAHASKLGHCVNVVRSMEEFWKVCPS